ncbi:MAG TPA: mannose-1-phosphate guanylyltransferase/mannose-6-phosphate isomerase [Thermohalobaculum sp.]|nr:mannose-1-phosphate guanylyltransferase/mannose-6-phosphate isomerase [Thermohalobaculum sp.]
MAGPSEIVPVILCGGSGTRLWPVSRRSYPKQFGPILDGDTLFARTVRRVAAPGYAPPLVLTTSEFRFIAADELEAAGVEPEQAGRIVIEPEMRNTGPAVCLGALMLAARDPRALMLVLPADHLIRDEAAFHRAVAAGAAAARAGQLVTFGVRPTRAETGYGWLELAGPPGAGAGPDPEPHPFLRFVEKPDRARAEAMLEAGRHLWNAGIFLFRAGDILAAFDAHAPEILAACRRALAQGREDLCFFRPGAAAYGASPAISLDYAVMERLGGGTAVPLDCGWNDLGAWDTVWRESPRDAQGTAARGAALSIGCRDSLLVAPEDGPRLVGLGLEGMIAVAMRDAVLVAPMARAQEVRDAVEALKRAGAEEAEEYPRCHRPWGWYEVLARGPGFQVKRIMVRPGGRLSLQSHVHRAEHWVVVAGTARVSIGEDVRAIGPDRSCYVPIGERHRLENPGEAELHLIEVQSGFYLGEDDITRYDDVYARE